MSDSLTTKQRAFCKRYIENGEDATEAANNAGYTQPQIQGIENLKKTRVVEYINKLKHKEIERDRNWEKRKRAIDHGHRKMADMDMAEAIKDEAIAAIWQAHKPDIYNEEDTTPSPNG